MDSLMQVWQLAGLVLIGLLLIVLYCLKGFIITDIVERRTARQIASKLPECADGLMSDVTLRIEPVGTTQVDHVLLAPHGLYVIEQKNYSGRLLGNMADRSWTKFGGSSKVMKLQNPFRQNYSHIKAIQHTLNFADLECINVVIINGKCKFGGTVKPDWLCMGIEEFARKVEARKHVEMFRPEALSNIKNQLNVIRHPPGLYTDLKHIRFLNNKFRTRMKLDQRITLLIIESAVSVLNRLRKIVKS
ncbi:NERD domain-containing protein [Enterobacter cloacae complex sp. ECC445]|uniref:nuclease-related domain-containing protein n=1 Tax=Enterobacter cloacae complex sp. ECC445 TaxID=2913213 RepID=UPI001F44C310|nr:nuclease-related domain-containing protein [Enterobacter cloacae complex sp. ECC445]MCG0456719.1 NERD domain-containing protein [Enterobacter cloacae complex sp. ECC445]